MNRCTPILGLCLLLACSEAPTTPADDPEPLPTLAVDPAQAAPGAIVSVTGVDVTALSGPVSVMIDGRESRTIVAADGAVLAVVPLYVESDGTVLAPPTGPVDVTLLDGASPAGELTAGFTVAARPTAPEALEDAGAALAEVVEGLRSVTMTLEPQAGTSQGYAISALNAVEELFAGDDENSLKSRLDALSSADPEARALVEGWLASSGTLDYLEALATVTADMASSLPAPEAAPGSPMRATALTDFDLASRMQLYVMLRDFGTQVLAETNQSWGNVVNAPGAFAGLFVDVPHVAVVSAILGVGTFALNNVVLAYLPATVDGFELVLAEPQVFSGEVAETEVHISASNNPAPITLLELVDLVLTSMGFAGSPDRETVRGVVGIFVDTFLSALRGQLAGYAQSHPNADFAYDVASIPSMSWTAEVTDVRFVEPRTFTPAVIDSTGAGILAWRAGIDAEGEGRIFAAMRTGTDFVTIPLIPGYEYNAGPFGDDILNTEPVSVQVGPPVVVVASMDSTISVGGLNGLEVRAGTTNAVGDTIWQPGMAVTLTVTGGNIEDAAGTTGADGRFDTFVSLEEGSDSVTVQVLVTASSGLQASTEVSAQADNDELVIETAFPLSVTRGVAEELRIDVLRRSAGASAAPEPFADIFLTVTGGSAAETAGQADAEGHWETFITSDAEAAEVRIEIRAVTLDGVEADTTIIAVNEDPVASFAGTYEADAYTYCSENGCVVLDRPVQAVVSHAGDQITIAISWWTGTQWNSLGTPRTAGLDGSAFLGGAPNSQNVSAEQCAETPLMADCNPVAGLFDGDRMQAKWVWEVGGPCGEGLESLCHYEWDAVRAPGGSD